MLWNGLEIPNSTYYQGEWVTQYCGDALGILPELQSDSIDLLCTDPPYGISFMGKSWDKALPDKNIWAECLRVLKPGAFAFVMSIPRADCLSRMIISLEDAGFMVNFTPIFWAYASGFPKAQNIGKAVDKRLGVKREVISGTPKPEEYFGKFDQRSSTERPKDNGAVSPQAKALDGSYGGFQPKPAVEVVIVAMKPLSEKTFVDQALKNRKGITWLDDGRIPYESEGDKAEARPQGKATSKIGALAGGAQNERERNEFNFTQQGRFPANLLVSDDVLNNGRLLVSPHGQVRDIGSTWQGTRLGGKRLSNVYIGDSGSFSRYFDLDKWAQKTFPFLIVPKASKSEKNKGLDLPSVELGHNRFDTCKICGGYILQNPDRPSACKCETPERQHNKIKGNNHPTVKPLKLMSYLITLGSRVGDVVADPFSGSGTTAVACELLNRKCIAVELKEDNCEIAVKRCSQSVMKLEV